MHQRFAAKYRSPLTQMPLKLEPGVWDKEEVIEGQLIGSEEPVPVVKGIPRFCPVENYADNFGFQWNHWSKTQLDSSGDWKQVSKNRLFGESCWPEKMENQKILEAGSGMGRFTEILATTGAEICTFDYSSAIEANYKNNKKFRNVCFAQADIYMPPYELESFDRVICIGVLQHCPDPKKAFISLVRFVKPGGEIFFDHYRLSLKSFFQAKYYLRPFTRLLPRKAVLKFVSLYVGFLYPITGFLQKYLGTIGRRVSWGLGMADYRGTLFDIDDANAKIHSLMDTHDMYSPAYDRPRTFSTIRSWMREAGLTEVVVKKGVNGIAASGRKPLARGSHVEALL